MLLICYLVIFVTSSMTSPVLPEDQEWLEYKQKYKKIYSEREDAWRREIWVRNSRKVHLHNANYKDSGYSQEVNMFSDMTSDEFTSRYCSCMSTTLTSFDEKKVKSNNTRSAFSSNLPDFIDWRQKGAVSPVKNQGFFSCPGTLSAIASLEGQWFLKSGKLIELSSEQVNDCCSECRGGYQAVWKYIKKAGGIEKGSDYHGDRSRKCKFDPKKVAVKVLGYKDLSKTEAALQEAVASIGPISVGINAGQSSFRMYRSGIYYDPRCSPKRINHSVLVVGYGSEGGREYWLVKNSWGKMWGMRGYIKMARNRGNNCGIASMASYPLV